MEGSVLETEVILKLDDNPIAPLALEGAKLDAETWEESYSSSQSKWLTGVYSGFKEDLANLCSLKSGGILIWKGQHMQVATSETVFATSVFQNKRGNEQVDITEQDSITVNIIKHHRNV